MVVVEGGGYCRQIFTLGPDVILNIEIIEIYKKFGLPNGSLTQSMHLKTQINHYDKINKSTRG